MKLWKVFDEHRWTPLAVVLLMFVFFIMFATVGQAAVEAPTGAGVTATSTTSITIGWTWGGGADETRFATEKSTDGVTFTVASSSIATTTLTYQFTGLSVNTQYTFRVTASTGVATSSYSTTSAVYTLANAAGTPTTGTVTLTTIPVTISVNSNPAATTYAIFNTTTGAYLSATGAASASPVWQTTSTWSSVSAIGLTANTAYRFEVVAKNGDGVKAATSSASTAVYTLTNVPSSVAATTNSSGQITVSWSGDGTNYYADNITGSTNSGWISDSSFAFTGLGCETSYTFRVKARNGDSTATDWSSSVSAYTHGCGGTGGGGSYVPPAVTVPPVVVTPPSC